MNHNFTKVQIHCIISYPIDAGEKRYYGDGKDFWRFGEATGVYFELDKHESASLRFEGREFPEFGRECARERYRKRAIQSARRQIHKWVSPRARKSNVKS